MTMARVFKSGNSQAVRLPREFRVECPALEIFHRGHEIVLRVPKERNISRIVEILGALPDDFLLDRNQGAHQIREEL